MTSDGLRQARDDDSDHVTALAAALERADRVRRILTAAEADGVERLAIHLAMRSSATAEAAIEAMAIARSAAGLPPIVPAGTSIH